MRQPAARAPRRPARGPACAGRGPGPSCRGRCRCTRRTHRRPPPRTAPAPRSARSASARASSSPASRSRVTRCSPGRSVEIVGELAAPSRTEEARGAALPGLAAGLRCESRGGGARSSRASLRRTVWRAPRLPAFGPAALGRARVRVQARARRWPASCRGQADGCAAGGTLSRRSSLRPQSSRRANRQRRAAARASAIRHVAGTLEHRSVERVVIRGPGEEPVSVCGSPAAPK